MSSKLVVVTLATSKQGTSAVRALLGSGLRVRGLTRDPSSGSSKALEALGAEMICAEAGDKKALTKAFRGAYAVFGITLPRLPLRELHQGQAIVDACLSAHVPLLIWSSQPPVSDFIGAYDLPEEMRAQSGLLGQSRWLRGLAMGLGKALFPAARLMDDKAGVEAYARAKGQPVVALWLGSFETNLFAQNQLHRLSPSDKWEIRFPVLPPSVAQPYTYIATDLGPSVAAIVQHWEDPQYRPRLEEKAIVLLSYLVTGEEIAKTITRVTGKQCTYVPDPNPDPSRLKGMYQFAPILYSYFADLSAVPPPILVEMGVRFHSFEDWVREGVVPVMNQQVGVP